MTNICVLLGRNIKHFCKREPWEFDIGDFAAKYLDFGLYVAFPVQSDEMFDCEIPLWEPVYHGITLYNVTPDTTNYTIKEKEKALKLVEYGGSPAFYFYCEHIDEGGCANRLGKVELLCDTDEQLKYSVSKIKEGYEQYKTLMHLQTEFMVSHAEVEKMYLK